MENERIIKKAKGVIESQGWTVFDNNFSDGTTHAVFVKDGVRKGFGRYARAHVWIDAFETIIGRPWIVLMSSLAGGQVDQTDSTIKQRRYIQAAKKAFQDLRNVACFSTEQRREIALMLAKNFSEDFNIDLWEMKQTFNCI